MIMLLISKGINAQEFIKEIELKEGTVSDIKYKNLSVSTFLQVYDESSSSHLIGDLYLRVDNDNRTIAEFYVDRDKSTKEYYTKTYKNYFLTYKIENNNKYLIIEQAKFGKPFAMSNEGKSTIGNKNIIEIEITDYLHEWSYDAPPEDENRSYFEDVHYTLKIKAKDIVKNFSFYSSEIKGNYTIELRDYSIIILSDKYKDSSVLIEMVINEKKNK